MAFFSCNSSSSSSSSSSSQVLYHLTNPNFLDDDDDDMLLLHQQQHHHHFVDEMMMMLTNCLFEGHTGRISAADDTSTSHVLEEGEIALPVDGDNKSPKFPAQEIPQEEKKRKTSKYIASMERKSKKICRRSSGEHEVDGVVKASNEEAPPSFVHVRARRGQATDSHSLAERVRRERISVRMKMLQNLVPGCDKMIGKAHILDAIINYVQSLQSQVEFLSMQIASMSSMQAVHFDDSMNLQAAHEEWMSPEEELMWKMGGRTEDPTTTMLQSTCSNNYEMMDQVSASSASLLPFLLLPSQLGPTSFSQDIYGSSFVVKISEQDQGNCQPNGPLHQ